MPLISNSNPIYTHLHWDFSAWWIVCSHSQCKEPLLLTNKMQWCKTTWKKYMKNTLLFLLSHGPHCSLLYLSCTVPPHTTTHTVQLMASGQRGLPGVSVLCRVEWDSSLGTDSVPAPSALAVASHVWALAERTKSASLLHVTVSLFCVILFYCMYCIDDSN